MLRINVGICISIEVNSPKESSNVGGGQNGIRRIHLTARSIFSQYLVCSTSALSDSLHHHDAIAWSFSSPDLLIIWKEPGWSRSLLVCREAFVLSEDLPDVRFGFRHDLQLFLLLCEVSMSRRNWKRGIGNGKWRIKNGEWDIGNRQLGIRDHI